MSTKAKITLAAVLVAATSSVALATDFRPNPANRYPAYAKPTMALPRGTLKSAPVRLFQGTGGQADPFEIDRNDRTSSPYAGGVG